MDRAFPACSSKQDTRLSPIWSTVGGASLISPLATLILLPTVRARIGHPTFHFLAVSPFSAHVGMPQLAKLGILIRSIHQNSPSSACTCKEPRDMVHSMNNSNVIRRSVRSAFFSAIEDGDLSLLKSLIQDHKIDVNSIFDDVGGSALHVAVDCSNLEMASLLKDLGLNPRLRDAHGRMAIEYACGPDVPPDLFQFLNAWTFPGFPSTNAGETVGNVIHLHPRSAP